MPPRQCQYHGYFSASEARIFFVSAGVSPANLTLADTAASTSFFRRKRLYDFLEARIAAEQVPEGVQF